MFDFLYQLLSVLTGSITKTFKVATSGVVAWLFSIYGMITTVLGAGLYVISKLNSFMEYVLTKLTGAFDAFTAAVQGSYGISGMGSTVINLCNTFFPLTELMGFGAVLLAVHGGFLVYRFVKSWIPTLS